MTVNFSQVNNSGFKAFDLNGQDSHSAFLRRGTLAAEPKQDIVVIQVVDSQSEEARKKKRIHQRNNLIVAATVPAAVLGGYFVSMRRVETKFFVDGAKTSREKFQPIVKELEPKIKKVIIQTTDKVNLNCWDINPQETQKYVIVCHGHSQNLTDCQHLYDSLHKKGYGVLALEYRGYGNNPGNFSEKGVYKDADAALQYLKDKGVDEKKIGVIGYSLGGAVATDLASRNNFAFAILTSTFNNAKDLSKNAADYLDIKLPKYVKKGIYNFPNALIPLQNSYRSDQKIAQIKCPIVFVHSKDDKAIPIKLAKKLSDKAKNSSQTNFLSLPKGGHSLDNDKIKTICDALDDFSL